MTLDRFLAVLAIVALVVFVSILIVFVKSPSLTIVVGLGISFAIYDFVTSAFGKKSRR